MVEVHIVVDFFNHYPTLMDNWLDNLL